MKTFYLILAMAVLLGATAVAQSNSNPYGSGSADSATSQQISNGPVAETVADSNAVIGWSTKMPASSSSVKYGTDRQHMTLTAQATDNSDGKNHHASLQNLSPNTTYYFQVTESGMPVGGIGTFRTVAAGERPLQSKAVISQK